MTSKAKALTLITAALAAVAVLGQSDSSWTLPRDLAPTPSTRVDAPAMKGSAASALESLTERRTARPGYRPEHFGQRWSDAATGVSGARNGCDTRIICTPRS